MQFAFIKSKCCSTNNLWNEEKFAKQEDNKKRIQGFYIKDLIHNILEHNENANYDDAQKNTLCMQEDINNMPLEIQDINHTGEFQGDNVNINHANFAAKNHKPIYLYAYKYQNISLLKKKSMKVKIKQVTRIHLENIQCESKITFIYLMNFLNSQNILFSHIVIYRGLKKYIKAYDKFYKVFAMRYPKCLVRL
ncbi:hypothetical protein H311_03609 [Anncaliia algerae PRA109]|nr:hypothetical protein H311_03609 [Anncaliia algerae PRA109]